MFLLCAFCVSFGSQTSTAFFACAFDLGATCLYNYLVFRKLKPCTSAVIFLCSLSK